MLHGPVQYRVGAQLRVDPQVPLVGLQLRRDERRAAALARLQQWPELVVGENVGIHKWYSATTCPATLDVTYLVSKANEYMGNGFTYKSVASGAATPTFATMASPMPEALLA